MSDMKIQELNNMLSYMAYKIFKPLVVLFLRNSIPYQTASDWLKRIYIDTAFDNKEFRINPEKKQTKTRVSVLTGLSRVEIDRILKIDKPLEVTEQKWNRATKVLSAWCNDPDYLSNNEPVVLPIYGELSFSSLVLKYSGGATMRSVLDELIYVKSVELNNDQVHLIRQDYAPEPDQQKLVNLEVSGLSTGSLLETLVFNDKQENYKNRRFQKIAFNRTIPTSQINEVKNEIHKKADKLIFSIDNTLEKLSDGSESESTKMVGIGIYYFEENQHENE